MSYHLKTKRKGHGPQAIPLVVVLLVATLTLGVRTFFPNAFGAFAYTVSAPFWKVKGLLARASGSSLSVFSTKMDLIRENNELKNERAGEEITKLMVDVLVRENLALKAELGRDETDQTILASVLVNPPWSLYDTVIIDVGEGKGVYVGAKVVAFDSVLVGE
ncbi:MAG: hypothetical protein Q7S15_00280, partial [bacterium]|nr:hypothetical protein [bacterium]